MTSWFERAQRMAELQKLLVIHIFNEAKWEYQCLPEALQWQMTDEEFQHLKSELYPMYQKMQGEENLY